MARLKYKCIDLFCGAGGMSYGFEMAGFDTVFAVEFNKVYAESYKLNFFDTDVYVGDIKEITDNQIRNILDRNGPIDLIIGGPPCQGFSIAGNIGRKFLDDPRNRLFKEYVRFVNIIKPKIFVLENVASLVKHNNGKTIREIIDCFKECGYDVKYSVLNSVDYNVPQERRRVFIVGTKEGMIFNYPIPINKKITIKEAIDDLPSLKAGESSDIDLHVAMNHTTQMLEKMKYVKDGGSRNDIPESIRPKSGDTRKYIRYASWKPSFCVTGDMRKIFHYSQNRALTCRELARIQTFPDSYKFIGNTIQIQQQIGNAVPCNLAYEVAKECWRCLKNGK